MTRKFTFGLVGHKISYSRSRDIFASIFKHTNTHGDFDLHDIPPDDFPTRFQQLLKSGIDGLSVTTPYKKRVIEYLNLIDPVAEALEAVNSIAIREGKTHGYNTDSFGFSLQLAKHREMLKQGTAIILGCGGAAKAAVHSLYTDYQVSRFLIVGRTGPSLEDFRDSLTRHMSKLALDLCLTSRFDKTDASAYDIVVNCTPLGGWNEPERSPIPRSFQWRPGKIYYDLNYNRGNVIVDQAASHGLFSIDGSAMLVGQAIRSWNLWTGLSAKLETVYDDVFTK